MLQNKHESFWCAKRAGLAALALMLGALIFGGLAGPSASGSPNNDKHKSATRVYQHTYDEVFQASLEAMERMGLFVESKGQGQGNDQW